MNVQHSNIREDLFTGQHLRLLRAGHGDHGTTCLIKTPVDDAAGPSVLAQLTHEYDLCRDLDLVGVLRPLAKETVKGRPAIVFEDPGGVALARLLATGPVALPLFLDMAIDLADIIGRLHRKGIVHKDIHSGNIIVCTDCDPVRVYLTGLGIASLLPGLSVEKTAPNKLEGTLSVMSPEQTGRMNRPVDFRTDFYSLGVVLYQMLTGTLPFTGDDPLALVHAHLAIEPKAPSNIDPQIPTVLSDLVLKLLTKDADDRFRSAAGIAADLKRCRDDWHRTGTISAFELARQDVSETFHLPDKLYGREEEIRTLQAAYERICNGPAELVLVTGYAGIGKTELVNQIRKSVFQKDGYFIAGKCDPLDRKIPCAPFIEAISDSVDQLLARPRERVDSVRKTWVQVLGDQGRVLTDVIPMLSLVIGKQPPVQPLPPDQASHRFHLMLQRLFSTVTLRRVSVVLFLDDLQWADFSTLKMLQTLACDSELLNVLLIGAYRDQDVDETHALSHTLKEIEATGRRIQTLALGPMKTEAVQALIADALEASTAVTGDLAALCQQKTGGNPFFIRRFLLDLVARKLLFFNPTRNAWQWHVEKISQADVTDNVIELMAGAIGELNENVQQALKTAACLGNRFDLDTLCVVHKQSPQTLMDDLWPAIQSGLISVFPTTGLRVAMGPHDATTRPVLVANGGADKIHLSFIHDRIQEAAYSLLTDDDKMDLHLRIGRLLLEKCDQAQLTEKIFDVLGQLNRAIPLISAFDEIVTLAELNLKAGQKARYLALFESAFNYFRIGIDLLADKGWQHQYALTKEFHLKGIEAGFVSGRYSELDRWFETAVDQIQSPIEAIDAYIGKIEKETAEGNLFDATNMGLSILAQLGIKLPPDPSHADFKSELEKTEQLLHSFTRDDIFGLPDMEDPRHLAALNIMINILPSAIWVKRELHDIITFKALRLLLRHGNCQFSALIFCTYALVINTILEKLEDVKKYGRLGMRFQERYQNARSDNRAGFLFYSLILPFSEHYRKTINPLKSVHQSCMEIGQFIHAGTSLTFHELMRFFTGEALESIHDHAVETMRVLKKIRHRNAQVVLNMHHQLVLNLMGKSKQIQELIEEDFDERIFLADAWQNIPKTLLMMICLNNLMLAYLFECFEAAVRLAEKVANIYDLPKTAIYISRQPFFCALSRLAMCETNAEPPDSALIDKVAADQQRLQLLADAAPMNHLHLLHLVKAESARVEGRILDAQDHFDRAIELAEENGYLQDQALANELAARFWMGRGKKTIAQAYMQKALDCYSRWGAVAKVNDLQEKHPEFFIASNVQTSASSKQMPQRRAADLDVMSALRASRAISGVIELDDLVEKLMSMVIENAGATCGRLLLEAEGRFYVTAEATADRPVQITRLGKNVAVEKAEHLLPLKIIQYVQGTGKSLAIEDAITDERYGQDPYIIKNRPRSILCNPIVRKEKLMGLIYLENKLAANAFTDERLRILEIVSAQIAVSLENADLYTERYKTLRALETRHAQLLSIFDSMDEVIYIADPQNYNLLYANEVFRKNWGDSIGQKCYRALQGRDTPCPFCTNDKIFGENLGKTHIWEFQNEINHRWYRCIDRAIKWTDGTMVRFEMAIDSHELKMAQIELEDHQIHLEKLVEERTLQLDIAKNQAEAANAAKSDFLARMSHEIRTPLNAVTGLTHIALKTQLTDEQRDLLSKIQLAGGNLLDVINDILDFSKVEAGRLELTPAPFDLDQVLERLADLFIGRMAQKNLKLRIEVAPQVPGQLTGDAGRLTQILTNLIGNAIKFTDTGEIVVGVDLDESDLQGQSQAAVKFQVSDTGVGIAADVLPTLFDPFTQADGSLTRRHEGTGLGLAICRQLVQLMGGRIWAESTPGHGSTFFFTIVPETRKDLPEASAQRRAQAPAVLPLQHLAGRRVLVVEDSELNRDVAMVLLEEAGLTVDIAENGRIAVDKVTGSEPRYYDAVLMDIQMPVLDGYQATQRIREWEANDQLADHRIPIIAVTAHALKGEKEKCLAADMDDYLPKPFDEQELHRVLLKWIASNREEKNTSNR